LTHCWTRFFTLVFLSALSTQHPSLRGSHTCDILKLQRVQPMVGPATPQ
jgi:hypothetical protein